MGKTRISRSLLNDKKDLISDDKFFTSRTMISHFENIIEGVCKAFKKRINIDIYNSGDSIACTNGNTVKVNLNNDWIKNAKSRIEKYYVIVGLVLHECGHILYTDFSLNKKCMGKLFSDNDLFPHIELSEETQKLFALKGGSRYMKIYQAVDNCIEDGHIEKRIIKYVPGYGECLMKIRKIQIGEESFVRYDKIQEQERETGEKTDHISCIMNLILFYAKYGIEALGDAEEDNLVRLFFEMKEVINAAVNSNNSINRKRCINIVFDMLMQFIYHEIFDDEEPPKSSDTESESSEEESDTESDKSDDEESSEEETDNEESSEGESESETSEEFHSDEESENSDKDNSDSEEMEETESSLESIDDEIVEDTSGDDGKGDDGSTKGMSMEEKSKALDELMDELEDTCEDMSEKVDHSFCETSETASADDDTLGESMEMPEEGADITPEADEGPDDWDLSYLEDEVATEEIAKDIKKGIEKEMAKIADKTRDSRIDKFPSKETYVEANERAEVLYQTLHEDLDAIARRVVKNLDKVIKERQKGDKQNGLYAGKMVDSAHAYRKDKKIFANKILPEDVPDMEVCVLVDCSGSMSCGLRMEQSVKCAYITWKFCQIMKIPCSVYGHTTDRFPEKHVIMTCVAHPDNIDKNDGKRIFMLKPENNNRDGWAVNFCCEALMKSSASAKLLLIISDGLPAAINYGETLGKKDCQEVVRRYKKKGISVITAGIDDCATDIKRLYLDGVSSKEAARFLDYSDMSQLPKAFANLIKKELL